MGTRFLGTPFWGPQKLLSFRLGKGESCPRVSIRNTPSNDFDQGMLHGSMRIMLLAELFTASLLGFLCFFFDCILENAQRTDPSCRARFA